jgi:hypothetical protein
MTVYSHAFVGQVYIDVYMYTYTVDVMKFYTWNPVYNFQRFFMRTNVIIFDIYKEMRIRSCVE